MARAEVPEVVVVDTHALFWFATDNSRRLGRLARRVFDMFEQGRCSVCVPATVLTELWFLSLNGTLVIQSSFRAWWRQQRNEMLVEVPLEHDDVLVASSLDWVHRDPQDRLIVATAMRLDVPLVTADEAIHDWGGIEVLW